MDKLTVLALALALAGCAATPQTTVVYRPVEVLVPVEVPRLPPASLAQLFVPEHTPKFISPLDPTAKVALSAEELNHLKTILRTLVTRDEAWRAWATEGATQ